MGLEDVQNLLRSVNVHGVDIRGVDFETYRSLNDEMSVSVAELARRSGRPTVELQASLNRLADCGLVGSAPDDRLYVRPNGPYRLAERLRALADENYARQCADILELQNEMSSPLERSLLAQASAPSVGQILDPEAGVRFINFLVHEARQEIAQISTGDNAGRASRVVHEAHLAAVRRGVRLRVICPDIAFRRATAPWQVGPDQAGGAEVRVISQPPTGMIMLDRRIAVTMPSGGGKWIVRGEGLIQPLCALFDTYWQLAQTPPRTTDDTAMATNEPTSEDRLLLVLLSRGLKDDAMAHHLGVSVRTVRRRVSELAQRLGGTSRFQIGVLAERRGWLSGDRAG